MGKVLSVNNTVRKTSKDVLNMVTNKQRTEITQRCTVDTHASNVASFSAVGAKSEIDADVRIDQENIVKNSCRFKAVVKAMEAGTISSSIASDVFNSQGGDSLFGVNSSVEELSDRVKNVMTNEQLVTIMSNACMNVDVQNSIPVSAIAGGKVKLRGAINQVNNSYNEALFDGLASVAADNGIDTSDITKETNKQGSGVTSTYAVVAGVVAVTVVVAVYLSHRKSRRDEAR